MCNHSTLGCTGNMLPHLYTGFRQVDGESQPLSHANIWVLRLLEGLLQSLQLRHSEGGAAAALLLLVAKPSFQNKLWQGRDAQYVITEIRCESARHFSPAWYFEITLPGSWMAEISVLKSFRLALRVNFKISAGKICYFLLHSVLFAWPLQTASLEVFLR